MNETSPPSPLSSTIKKWWIVWTADVVGGPVLAMVALAMGGIGEGSGAGGLVVGFVLLAGFVIHIVASVVLARSISRRRDPDAKAGAVFGLTLGLLFGGWAVKAAIYFVGCLGLLAMK